MVAIYDVSDSLKAEDLRAFLIASGIPCRLFHGEFTETNTTSLVNITENGSETPKDADPESILFSNFDKEEYSSEKIRLYHRILDVLHVKYGINPMLTLTKLYCDTSDDVRFCGVSLKLSHTQRLMLKHLAINAHRRCSAEELAAFCLANGGTPHHVSVQMDNVRKHVASETGKLIVDSKRGAGYKILDDIIRP